MSLQYGALSGLVLLHSASLGKTGRANPSRRRAGCGPCLVVLVPKEMICRMLAAFYCCCDARHSRVPNEPFPSSGSAPSGRSFHAVFSHRSVSTVLPKPETANSAASSHILIEILTPPGLDSAAVYEVRSSELDLQGSGPLALSWEDKTLLSLLSDAC